MLRLFGAFYFLSGAYLAWWLGIYLGWSINNRFIFSLFLWNTWHAIIPYSLCSYVFFRAVVRDEKLSPRQKESVIAYALMFVAGLVLATVLFIVLDPETVTYLPFLTLTIVVSSIAIPVMSVYSTFNESESPAEEVPPEPKKQDKALSEWIEAYQPALPPKAKRAFIEAAEEVVALYEKERIASTSNEMDLKRREKEYVRPLADVQMELFERYQKLAKYQPKEDDYPSFPLAPEDYWWSSALNGLDDWFLPWRPTPKPDWVIGTEWENHRLATTPFIKVIREFENRS